MCLVVLGIVKWYQGTLHKYPPPDPAEAAQVAEKVQPSSSGSSAVGLALLTGAAGPLVAAVVVTSALAASVMVVALVGVLTAIGCATHFKVSGRGYP